MWRVCRRQTTWSQYRIVDNCANNIIDKKKWITIYKMKNKLTKIAG